ncbi:hypothetical protein JDS92_26415 [Bacillus cereus group sp. N12]|uniref:hypothetical protein n=1 Tax=Bacillus cereus group sp. N12 TaxID=2794586 RepID=UPI0018F461F8|nr:hypothetical protein [Bacillus cereus group sp. N12]MBJ8078850.1 hypothetical protein [Bacillus cereus group sp. N12]
MLFPASLVNNRYEVISIIGRAGMGEVWLSKDNVLERNIVLKGVNSLFLKNEPNAYKILRDEAIAGAKLLGHTNIVNILDYGKIESKVNETYFIAMEYVEGELLKTG